MQFSPRRAGRATAALSPDAGADYDAGMSIPGLLRRAALAVVLCAAALPARPAPPLSPPLSDRAAFRATVDRLAGRTLTELGEAALSRLERTTYRLAVDPAAPPYDRWAAAAGADHPGYFVAGADGVAIRLGLRPVGLDAFNYDAAAPDFGVDADGGPTPLALFGRETRQGGRRLWTAYDLAIDGPPAIHAQRFAWPAERRAELHHLRVVVEFRPRRLPGARRLVGRRDFGAAQRWLYLGAAVVGIDVIDRRDGRRVHGVRFEAP